MKPLSLFLTLSALAMGSWAALCLGPHLQLGPLAAVVQDDAMFPPKPSGAMLRGEQIYTQLACFSCHTQQVQAAEALADIKHGFGPRQSVARDYIFRKPLLGARRLGPDLSDVGSRFISIFGSDKAEDALHVWLYDSRLFKGSVHAHWHNYKRLYVRRPAMDKQRFGAVKIPVGAGGLGVPEGYEVFPSHAARELVAYLMGLRLNYPLPEMPLLAAPESVSGSAAKSKAITLEGGATSGAQGTSPKQTSSKPAKSKAVALEDGAMRSKSKVEAQKGTLKSENLEP